MAVVVSCGLPEDYTEGGFCWLGDGRLRTRYNLFMPAKNLPTWREMNADTTPEVEAILFKLWRETPGWRKLEMMENLNRTAREVAIAGLKRRFPTASQAELTRRLASLLLGEELAFQVYGPYSNNR